MGTRADFYIGIGKDAEWIGSSGYDGHCDHNFGVGRHFADLDVVETCTKQQYERAVEKWLGDDGIYPASGWPWPWDDSSISDHAYAWHKKQIWVTLGCSTEGKRWVKLADVHEHSRRAPSDPKPLKRKLRESDAKWQRRVEAADKQYDARCAAWEREIEEIEAAGLVAKFPDMTSKRNMKSRGARAAAPTMLLMR